MKIVFLRAFHAAHHVFLVLHLKRCQCASLLVSIFHTVFATVHLGNAPILFVGELCIVFENPLTQNECEQRREEDGDKNTLLDKHKLLKQMSLVLHFIVCTLLIKTII